MKEQRHPIGDEEKPALITVVAGIGMAISAVSAYVLGVSIAAALVMGLASWFLIPFGLYREAEALTRQNVLWGPSFWNIGLATIPIFGIIPGGYFLVKRFSIS